MKSPRVILASCLILQMFFVDMASAKAFLNSRTGSQTTSSSQLSSLQGQELGSAARGKTRGTDFKAEIEMLMFVQSRTAELLPAAFRADASRVANAIIETAQRYDMDPIFLMSVIRHESRFNPNVIGRHGEVGLMQIKPSTAKWLIEQGELIHVKADRNTEKLKALLKDPVTNIAFGTAYLAHLRRSYTGHGARYLAAYNVGSSNLKSLLRHGHEPRRYVERVMGHYTTLKREFKKHRHLSSRQIASLPVAASGLFANQP